jgi:hypothetical protein
MPRVLVFVVVGWAFSSSLTTYAEVESITLVGTLLVAKRQLLVGASDQFWEAGMVEHEMVSSEVYHDLRVAKSTVLGHNRGVLP